MNKTWQVVLAFLVVFVAGGAIGSVFTLRFMPAPTFRPGGGKSFNGRSNEEIGPRLMGKWLLQNNEFNLSPEQKQQIREIVWDAAEDLQRTRVETAHSAMLLLENMQDRISAVLDPQQRERFHQKVEEQRQEFQRFTREYQRRAMEDAQQARSGGDR